MLRVKHLPESVRAIAHHFPPVGFDLLDCLLAQPALQQGGDKMMTEIGGIHGDSGRMAHQPLHDRQTLFRVADFRQHQPDLLSPGNLTRLAADEIALCVIPELRLRRGF